MTALSPDTMRRRLERAGYEPLPRGWLPAKLVARIQQQLDMHAEDVEQLLSQPAQPRGRPKKN